jgi:hypothetical protein
MTRSAYGLITVVALACDPTAAGPKPDAAPAPASPAAAASDAEAREQLAGLPKPDPAPPNPEQFATCMSACAGGEKLSATDAASCRLQCLGRYEATAAAERDDAAWRPVLVAFEACEEPCAGEAGSNRVTCRLQCAQHAARSEEPPALTGDARGCATACLEGLVDCAAACPTEADAAATCRLQCDSGVERCLPGCVAAP